MPERVPAIKVLLLASAVEARKTAPLRYVTKAMQEVARVGRTSVTVKVMVEGRPSP